MRAVSPASANLLRTHGELISVTETEVQIALGDAWRPLLESRKPLLSGLAKGRAIVWVEPPAAAEPTCIEHQGPAADADPSVALIDRAAQSLAAAFSGTVLQLDPEVAAVLASELHGAAVAVHHGDQEPLLAALRRVCRADARTEENGTLGSERSEEEAGQ